MNVKWEKVTKLYQDNKNHLWDYDIEQYEILNNLFKDVKTVKCIGGGPTLDFFIAQTGNNVKQCVNIDNKLQIDYRGNNYNLISLHDQYKDYFNYNGEYEFVLSEANKIPVFDKPYDVVIDNVGPDGELDYTLTNPPKIYIINHNKHIENFQWCVDFNNIIPMQFATRESCFYSFDYIEPVNEYYDVVHKKFKIKNKWIPLIVRDKRNDARRFKKRDV